MKVLISMAGQGSRFKQEGIDTPKHMLTIDDRTMFNYSMSSLSNFFDEEFVFVCRSDRDDASFIEEECNELGISEYETVELPDVTEGQATSALQADSCIRDDETVVIYNIDTYVEPGHLKQRDIAGAGWIPVFRAEGDQWSFVRQDKSGNVTEVAEKERISSYATIGLYHFTEWEIFKRAYNAIADTVREEYGETYICPLYQWIIDTGKRVRTTEVPKTSVHVLGTPEDVIDFYPPFSEEHNLEQ